MHYNGGTRPRSRGTTHLGHANSATRSFGRKVGFTRPHGLSSDGSGVIFPPCTLPGSHRPRVAPNCVRWYSSPSTPRLREALYNRLLPGDAFAASPTGRAAGIVAHMTECRHCQALWWRHGQRDAEAVHPACPSGHPTSGPIGVGPGPITAFGWLRTDGPPVAFAQGPAPLLDRGVLLDATATDLDPDLAAIKAVAELLERQTAFLRPRAPIRLDASDPLCWQVEARVITGGDPVLVPMTRFMLSTLGTDGRQDGSDSTGMAAGQSSRSVIVAGVLEVIERDGVDAIDRAGPAWRLDTTQLSKPYRSAVRRNGWAIDAIGVWQAGLAVCVCVASDESRSVVGAAARTDPRAAGDAALTEAYAKTVGLRGDNCASVPMAPPIPTGDLWPCLPSPLAVDRADPLSAVHRSGVPLAMVDRGNALLDAIGWRAVQVVRLGESPTPGNEPAAGRGRLRRLL